MSQVSKINVRILGFCTEESIEGKPMTFELNEAKAIVKRGISSETGKPYMYVISKVTPIEPNIEQLLIKGYSVVGSAFVSKKEKATFDLSFLGNVEDVKSEEFNNNFLTNLFLTDGGVIQNYKNGIAQVDLAQMVRSLALKCLDPKTSEAKALLKTLKVEYNKAKGRDELKSTDVELANKFFPALVKYVMQLHQSVTNETPSRI